MKKRLAFTLVYILLSLYTISQTITNKGGVQLASGVGGYYEYLPKGYDGVKKFPLILFLHGLGNQGNGTVSAVESLVAPGNGLMAMLKSGSVPDQGMIVIAPQFGGWPTPEQSLQVLNRIIQLYPVDTNKIYVTGLSMGGGATWELAALAGKKIAAIAPICGASSPDAGRINALVSAGMPILAFHDQRDPVVAYSNSTGYINGFNSRGGKPTAILYTYNSGIHNSWGDAYLPYQGIYDFFRKYNRGVTDTATPVPPTPSMLRISASEKPPTGWVSDIPFVYNMTRGNLGGVEAIWGTGQTRTISGTTDQSLYQTERWGQWEYRIPVANGNYTVKLHFAEIWLTTVGRRVFNVDIEGNRVLSNFDMLALAPRYTAIQRSFDVTVADGILNMSFTNMASDGKITAIEVLPKGGVVIPPPQFFTTINIVDSASGKLLKHYTDSFLAPVKVIVK